MKASPSELRQQRKARLKFIKYAQEIARIDDLRLSAKLVIGDCASLGSFRESPRHEQDVRLLKRLAVLFPQGQTFDPHRVPVETDGLNNRNGLAFGFPPGELRDANLYILTYLWPEIVRTGYVAEAPPGSGRYQITDEGWGVVEGIKFRGDDGYLPF
jgi:hypothetical protein